LPCTSDLLRFRVPSKNIFATNEDVFVPYPRADPLAVDRPLSAFFDCAQYFRAEMELRMYVSVKWNSIRALRPRRLG